ncbi:hypothetical protein Ahy_Scaffold1g106655 isoform B [Arachis hypogaea]|uniref:Uncharacterized protein n=1 Tax=Arachis hypogaea TaxID=3818 RepID=A0A444WR20_ARAHY|nr:hypothetical protein Ahy_Scaffold1g106655 isoform B [Arachis hypogaea]
MEILHHCHTIQPFSIFDSHPSPWRPHHPKPYSHSRVSCSNNNNFRRWDSNAEPFRRRNFNRRTEPDEQQQQQRREREYWSKRRWWSDEPPDIDEGSSGGVWEEVIDSMVLQCISFFSLQVFKSYGWALPFIIVSFLLSTGPKAFLMALALPLGQSALQLAFEKLWGQPENKPKRKYRTRRKPRGMNGTTVDEEAEENSRMRTGRTGYQSWVVEDNNSSAADSGNRESQSFRGWDDLERSRSTSSSRMMDGSRSTRTEAGRLSRREVKSDTPLLLRLLIAIFPFLGTWTKML